MRKVLILVATLAIAAAACGGDEGDEAGGETGSTGSTGGTATAPTGGTATGPTATGATATGPTSTGNGGCPDLTGEGEIFTITISGFAFVPDCFTASASQAIEIVNEDTVPHNFTIPDTEIFVPVSPEDTFRGEPASGVIEPGTYDFLCTIHPTMTGEVTVVA
jgi:plastocyanin